MSLPHFDVGKYAAFIWPAYAVSAAGFAWMVGATLARARRWRREVERLEAARPKKPGAAGEGAA
ncbi:heme exporter protein CcmD [Caulobacter sp. KR2-114]|uniref:heme exporter protein CcmD n=1 Tax=Caulobacter sp. KR2-114 TaxID=3400912 RepID=UPI003C110A53